MSRWIPPWLWPLPQSAGRPGSLTLGQERYLQRQRLCRTLRRLAHQGPSRRALGLCAALLGRRDLALALRLEAARTLGQWDPGLALESLEPILESSKEPMALKARLIELAASWERPEADALLRRFLASREAAVSAAAAEGLGLAIPAGRGPA